MSGWDLYFYFGFHYFCVSYFLDFRGAETNLTPDHGQERFLCLPSCHKKCIPLLQPIKYDTRRLFKMNNSEYNNFLELGILARLIFDFVQNKCIQGSMERIEHQVNNIFMK